MRIELLVLCLLAWIQAEIPVRADPAERAVRTTRTGKIELIKWVFPGGEADFETPLLPLYLAIPDSLGTVVVRDFLAGGTAKAAQALETLSWSAKPLQPNERRFLQGMHLLVEGKLREAGKILVPMRNAPMTRDLRQCLHNNLAVLFFMLGLPKEAEGEFKSILSKKELLSEAAWRNLFSIYIAKKKYTTANELVEKALEASQHNEWAHLGKSYLIRLLQSESELEAYLREKSSWRDSLFEIQIAYGKLLKEKGEWKEASKYFGRGLEGAPQNGSAWLDLAEVYYRMHYYAFAEQCLIKSFQAGIDNPFIFELYGLVMRDYGIFANWKKALSLLEEGLPKNPHSRTMAQLLYNAYCQTGKVAEAGNLRSQLWFHFQGPLFREKYRRLDYPLEPPRHRLVIRFSAFTTPLVVSLWESGQSLM